jgi:hypothetical protein
MRTPFRQSVSDTISNGMYNMGLVFHKEFKLIKGM